MIVEFDKSFFKYLARIRDNSILRKIKNKTIELENANSLNNIRNLKKLTVFLNLGIDD
jgi:hypothetical protein